MVSLKLGFLNFSALFTQEKMIQRKLQLTSGRPRLESTNERFATRTRVNRVKTRVPRLVCPVRT